MLTAVRFSSLELLIMAIFDILKRSRRRTIGIRITEQGQVVMFAPLHCSETEIHAFAKRFEQWIIKKKQHVETVNRKFPEPQFIEGEQHFFHGNSFPIVFREGVSGLLVFDNAFIMPPSQAAMVQHRLRKWLIQQAALLIPRRVAELAVSAGLQYRMVKINSAKLRWGSCNINGNLNFSWHLVMCPPPVIDYVIIHELSHLAEMNHSKKFWRTVEILCPDYRLHKKWLRLNGRGLKHF